MSEGGINATTRRGFVGAVIAAAASALVIVLLWLISRGAPSAGRDPSLTPEMPLPTRIPTAAATPGG